MSGEPDRPSFPHHVLEELEIMEESVRPPRVFQADAFDEPISVLCRHPAITTDVSATVGDVIAIMQKEEIGSVLVTQDGKLVGIVTERDVLRKVCPEDRRSSAVTEIMTPDPESLRPDDAIAYVMNKMHQGDYRHVPIVDDEDRPIHIVSLKDVLRFILDHFPRELNVAPNPYRGEPKEWGG